MAHRFLAVRRLVIAALAAVALQAFAHVSHAGERRFTYLYEPKVLPAGAVEFETWWTSRIGKASGVYNRWDLRTELEFGLTDTLQTAFYLNTRGVHQDGARVRSGDPRVTGDSTTVKGISNEWLWKLTDAAADPIGVGLYAEWGWDGKEPELELKALFGKELSGVSLAYNLIVEWEWEFEHDALESKLKIEREAFFMEHAVGASVALARGFRLGLEGRSETRWAGFTRPRHTVLFAGPNLHYTGSSWWVTFTLLVQIGAARPSSHGREFVRHEQVEARLLVGIDLPGPRRGVAPIAAGE